MYIKGTILEILPVSRGESKNRNWVRQQIIIETDEKISFKVCLVIAPDKIDISNLYPGQKILAAINLESREFNGRWYTEARVWKIDTAVGVL